MRIKKTRTDGEPSFDEKDMARDLLRAEQSTKTPGGDCNGRQSTPVAGLLEAAHELVKEHHLAGRHNEAIHSVAIIIGAAEVGLRALKQERVVAALLQLRDDVQQADLRAPLRALHPPSKASNIYRVPQPQQLCIVNGPKSLDAALNCKVLHNYTFLKITSRLSDNIWRAGQALITPAVAQMGKQTLLSSLKLRVRIHL